MPGLSHRRYNLAIAFRAGSDQANQARADNPPDALGQGMPRGAVTCPAPRPRSQSTMRPPRARRFELAKSALASIDMLITDMVMPRMNGRELSQSLRARRPGLPVLFISGYSDVIPSEEEFFNVTTQFLQKPFNSDSLGHRVRELLVFGNTSGPPQKSFAASS